MAPLLLFVLSSLLAGQSFATPPNVLSLPIRRSWSNITLDLDKRDPFAASIQNLLAGHQYFITAQVGTPPQNLELVIDTGSSDTWMFGTGSCRASAAGPCIGGEFDSSQSSTYKNLQPQLGEYKNIYGDGSKVKGPYFSDKFTIGGATVNALTMGLASFAKGIIRSGIMGIGYDTNEGRVAFGKKPYPNLPDLLVSQGLISSKSFSLYLDDIVEATGSVLFGGYDTAKFYGDMTMLPIQIDPDTGAKDAFFVSLRDFGLSTSKKTYIVESNHDPYPIAVLLDSGTEDINMPLELFEPFIRTFNLKPLERGLPGLFAPFQVDCDILDKHGPADVVFAFGSVSNGPIIKVPLQELIVPFYNPKSGKQVTFGRSRKPFCRFGISASAPGNPVILGQTFLRSAYALYDLDNGAVGLAQAKYDQKSSHVIEYKKTGKNPKVFTDVGEPTAVSINYQASTYYENLPYVTPSVLVTDRPYTVSYPKVTPPGHVATTPSPEIGKTTDNRPGGTKSPGNKSPGNDASSLLASSTTSFLMLTTSILLSLGSIVYML